MRTTDAFPDYPFTPRRLEVRPGIGLSYLDEGPRDGEAVVMLHGNPSWSYYWRHLVLALRDKYRCIVPDHVGMGLSDKPDDAAYRYTLQSRVDDLDALLDKLGVTGPVTLAVHDWGGMIGMGWAMRHAERVKRWVVLNTAMFPLPDAKPMPWQLSLGRDSRICMLDSPTIIVGTLSTTSGPSVSWGMTAGCAVTLPVLVTISSVSLTRGLTPRSAATSDAIIVRLEPVSSQKL